MTNITGWHRYNRVSGKGADEGKAVCEICGRRPDDRHAKAVWRFILDAEEENKRAAEQRKLMRLVKNGYVE